MAGSMVARRAVAGVVVVAVLALVGALVGFGFDLHESMASLDLPTNLDKTVAGLLAGAVVGVLVVVLRWRRG